MPAEVRIGDPVGVLAVLLAVLALVFWLNTRPVAGRVFKIIPSLVFCYFVPTALSMGRIIPAQSELYVWVKEFLLPASLVALTLSLDVRGILRLGPKAGIMMLAGTAGVMLGGPIALAIWHDRLPPDAWRALSYIAGSWIGGSANGLALQRTFGASDTAVAPLIVVDIAISGTWLGLLLFGAARHRALDRLLRADASALGALGERMERFHAKSVRVPAIGDLLAILAVTFGATWLSQVGAGELLENSFIAGLRERGFLDAFGWKVVLATTIGAALSFTPVRSLEGAGASKIGTLMIYILVACIGAGADLRPLLTSHAGWYLALGVTWIAIHAVILLTVSRLIRAPFFYIAVASQANIGGAASAPIVAGAFNPALAPVGVLLAVAGYVLGTYGGWLSTQMCRLVAGAE
jgi:uncharacterized membrane protein